MTGYKSRRRWLAERWLAERKAVFDKKWGRFQQQFVSPAWPERMAAVQLIPDGEVSGWQPAPGSSSAELRLWVDKLPLFQRRWLAALLGAPRAGSNTLIDAIERQQLDWRSQLNPLKSHRDYANQLAILANEMGCDAAAPSAYLENEKRIFVALDELLFGSLPMRLRSSLANEHRTGHGFYVVWWYERLMARAGMPDFELTDLSDVDWPDMPPAWLALGWLCGLRLQGAN
ncbi:hypothetical protein SAMN05216271_0702 [Halopseudomonas sabulinigri]|uniref:Uncharacterized protein n=1 Tax=Halopseudomonas sabulinigri TaxID=472181 RepID=A0A1H1MUS4_9GAMM|nr:hypothetical protein [Halopseudomonas sabulinigri]SDR90651.1 hypothetical protein SAMN05216271_0702 [Halopseudomonas sabulinigri]